MSDDIFQVSDLPVPADPSPSPRTGLVLVAFAHGRGVVLYEDMHEHVYEFIKEGGFGLDTPFGLDRVNVDYEIPDYAVGVGKVELADDGPGDYPGSRETRAEVRGLRPVSEEEWRYFSEGDCPFGEYHAPAVAPEPTKDYLDRLKWELQDRLEHGTPSAAELVHLGELAAQIDEIEHRRAREAVALSSMKSGMVQLAGVVGPAIAKMVEGVRALPEEHRATLEAMLADPIGLNGVALTDAEIAALKYVLGVGSP